MVRLYWLLLLAALLLPGAAQAQAPAWSMALTPAMPMTLAFARTTAVATDASGNVLVCGYFNRQLAFGSTILTSAGEMDAFLAKYVPATGTWAWAVRAGGTGYDYAYDLAVSSTGIYLVGSAYNNRANTYGVAFNSSAGGPAPVAQAGVGTGANSDDWFVAKYTDLGTSVACTWTQVGGGFQNDYARGVAVSGTRVYVTGFVRNNTANAGSVVFGGTGTTAGTVSQAGASSTVGEDLVLAAYTDQGPAAALRWTQVAGGTSRDGGYGLAIDGPNVYVAGLATNNRTNANQVLLGGTGLVPGTIIQPGASTRASTDILLVKYVDAGPTATLGWTQVAGGTDDDAAYGLANVGNALYLTGMFVNNRANVNQMLLGGSGAVPGTVTQLGPGNAAGDPSLLLVRYTDLGSTAQVNWTQAGGGEVDAVGQRVAVAGSRVYVTGYITNDLANTNQMLFGASGTAPGTVVVPGVAATYSLDVVVAGYTDQGTAAALDWVQVAGGPSSDYGVGVAVAADRLYVGATATVPAQFGSFAITQATSTNTNTPVLAALPIPRTLAATPAAALPMLRLFPNPASGPATLAGAAPHTPGQVLDALGRPVATFATDNTGSATLPAGLAPGLYLVRVGAATGRWVVQ